MSTAGSTSSNQLLESLTSLAAKAYGYKGIANTGSGVKKVVHWAKGQHILTPGTLNIVIPELPGVFGGYPQDKGIDRGPTALFIALFAVLFLAHLGVYARNTLRKHHFPLQFGLAIFCAMKIIGYACRLAWSRDVANIPLGITSLVFVQVAQLVLQCQNLMLAHRIFTWYHPQTGGHWVFAWVINFVYMMVLAIIAIAIVGQGLPYIYFLDHHHHTMCRNVMKAAAILNLIYSTIPFQFLLATFAFKPGSVIKLPQKVNSETNDTVSVMPKVYQPTWIKSGGLFYYPEKNGQLNSYHGEDVSDAVRIIPSRNPPSIEYRKVNESEEMHPESPRMRWAIVTVVVSSFVLVMNTCFRVAACFHNKPYATVAANGDWHINFWPHHPYVMFIFYGATEVAILTFYLLMRIDLRFYIPDVIKNKNITPRAEIPNEEFVSEKDVTESV